MECYVNREREFHNFLEVDDYAHVVFALASEAHSIGLNCQQATEVINNDIT